MMWLWAVDGLRPTSWDVTGALVALSGMAIIIFQPQRLEADGAAIGGSSARAGGACASARDESLWPAVGDSECPTKVGCFAIGADDNIDDEANGRYGCSCDPYGAQFSTADETSPEFYQTFKSAEHLGGNSGGNSISFRSFSTLEFDSRRRLGYNNEEMTGHGFRAMARTILDEVLHLPPHLIEHQLAHAVRDPNGRAYNRTTHLPERREMMQQWADYLSELRSDAKAKSPLRR